MTHNARSRLSDLKVIGLIVSITIGLAGMGWAVVSWATTRVSGVEAAKEHAAIVERMEPKAHAAEQISAVHARINNMEARQVAQQQEIKQTLDKLDGRTWLILDKLTKGVE